MTYGPHVASDRIYGARCGALRYSRYCLGHFLKPIFLRELRNEKAFFARFQMDGRYSGRGRMYGLCGCPVQCEAHQSSPKPRGVPEVTAKRVCRPHEECAFPGRCQRRLPGSPRKPRNQLRAAVRTSTGSLTEVERCPTRETPSRFLNRRSGGTVRCLPYMLPMH